MTLLVVGEGAEGIRDELGRSVTALVVEGLDVVGIDRTAGAQSCLSGGPDDVVAWAVRTMDPDLTLVVDEGPLEPAALPGHPVVRVGREQALAVLASLSAEVQPRSALDSTGVRLAASSSRAARSPGPRVRVRVSDRAPRVSIVSAFFNQEPFAEEAMRSMLDNTFDDFEVVVVDDGSTDATPSILAKYAGDPRVRVLTQENVGGTGRMDLVVNQTMRAARGEFVAGIGGDDVNLPQRLAAQLSAFDADPGLGVVHGASALIDSAGRELSEVWTPPAYDEFSLLRTLVQGNMVGHPTVMIRRDSFERLGGYEEGLDLDYHFWMKAAGVMRFRYLPQRLVKYRVHERSLSTSATGKPRAEREALRLRSQALGHYALEQFFPELEGVEDGVTRDEAAIALANSLMPVDPRLSLQVYRTMCGTTLRGDVHFNEAVAHLVLGDRAAALDAIEAGSAVDPSVALLGDVVRGAASQSLTLRAPDGHLRSSAARARRERGATCRRWDGTTLETIRVYVALDPSAPEVASSALALWTRLTTPGTPLRWCIPTLGRTVEEVFAHVVDFGRGLELSRAADIVIEVVDDWALVPAEAQRLTGVLATNGDLDVFRSWLTSATSGQEPRFALTRPALVESSS